MTIIRITASTVAGALVALSLVGGCREPEPDDGAATNASITAEAAHPSFLHGRVTTTDGTTYEGRLRFGGNEEAFWGDYFNGFKGENIWAGHVPTDSLPKERQGIDFFGIEIGPERPSDLGRPFMARFGDIAKIEANGRDLRVTLKSGAEFNLDRFAADDLADGMRVWDETRGVVDLDEARIRAIEFVAPAVENATAPSRLHGTVRTQAGDFTGFIQWDRAESLGSDELAGYTADGEQISLHFDSIRSIARFPPDSSRVTRSDGREIVLGGTQEVGTGNRGMFVDDLRYGRVLVPWETFDRVDFSPGGSGSTYGDFPRGGTLTGRVTTRLGRRLTGRLVYDLDEGETTETLDAPFRGVDYTIPFGLVGSILLPAPEDPAAGLARVTLHDGEELQLERSGDLGDDNAGMLVFPEGQTLPEYVPWSEIARVDFDRPAAENPPIEGP